jgi:ABC-type multidrug transport system fused ATPase/permease subunit
MSSARSTRPTASSTTAGNPLPSGAARSCAAPFCFMTGRMLELKNLSKTYRTGDKALQNVTLTVPKGQVMA